MQIHSHATSTTPISGLSVPSEHLAAIKQINLELSGHARFHQQDYTSIKNDDVSKDLEATQSKKPTFLRLAEKVCHSISTKVQDLKTTLENKRQVASENHFTASYAEHLSTSSSSKGKEAQLFKSLFGFDIEKDGKSIDKEMQGSRISSIVLPIRQKLAHAHEKLAQSGRIIKAKISTIPTPSSLSFNVESELKDVKNSLSQLSTTLKDGIHDIYTQSKESIHEFSLKTALTQLRETTSKQFDKVKENVSDLADFVREKTSTLKEEIPSKLSQKKDRIETRLNKVKHNLYYYQVEAESKFEDAQQKLTEARQNIHENIQSFKESVKEFKTDVYYQSIKMQGQVDSLPEQLNQKIDEQLTQLKNKLDLTKQALDTKIQNTQTHLENKSHVLADKVHQLTSKLTIKSKEQKSEVKGSVADFTITTELEKKSIEELYDDILNPVNEDLREIFLKSALWLKLDPELMISKMKNLFNAESNGPQEILQKQTILKMVKQLILQEIWKKEAVEDIIDLASQDPNSEIANLGLELKALTINEQFDKMEEFAQKVQDGKTEDARQLLEQVYHLKVKDQEVEGQSLLSVQMDKLTKGQLTSKEKKTFIKAFADDLDNFNLALFKAASPKEWISFAKNSNELNPNLKLLAQSYNQLSFYIQDRLIQNEEPEKLTQLYDNFFNLTEELLKRDNYLAAYAIYNGLINSTVENFFERKGVEILPRHIKSKESYNQLFSMSFNYKNLRKKMNLNTLLPVLSLYGRDFTTFNEIPNTTNDGTSLNLDKMQKLAHLHETIEVQQKQHSVSPQLNFDILSEVLMAPNISEEKLFNKMNQIAPRKKT